MKRLHWESRLWWLANDAQPFDRRGRAKPSSFLSSAFSPLKQKTLAYYAGSDFTRTSTRAIYLVAAAFLQGQQRRFRSRVSQPQILRPEHTNWFTLSFGWDETKQLVKRSYDAAEGIIDIEPPHRDGEQTGSESECPLPKSKVHPSRGKTEYTHSMVLTGCVAIKDTDGRTKEEVVFPCREMASTKSEHIGHGLLESFEQYLFGCTLPEFLAEHAPKYAGLSLICTGDSASANMKASELLFSYVQKLGQDHGIPITAIFTRCHLHQLSRILALHLERQSLSAAMYSVTRLHQHSRTRELTRDKMKELYKRHFRFVPGFPAMCEYNRPAFRKHLLSLLSGCWDGEVDENEASRRVQLVDECLRFFNGDLSNTQEWTHYCHGLGCHDSEHHACQHGWQLLHDLFFMMGNDTYVPTRWTKVSPPLRHWAAGVAIHGALRSAYQQCDSLQQDDGAEANSEDAYRRAMAVRKKRAREFLSNECGVFTLLLILTFHQHLSNVTKAAFKLRDADKADVEIEKQDTKTARVRMRYKAREQFREIDADGLPRAPSLLHVFNQAMTTVNILWHALSFADDEGIDGIELTLFSVCKAFWPRHLPRPEMLRRIASDSLATIAGLLWRVMCQAKSPPYSLLHLANPLLPSDQVEEATVNFMNLQPCCLDQHWGQVVFNEVKKKPLDQQPHWLRQHVFHFSSSCRGTSSREECLHASQRRKAKGYDQVPALFQRQSAEIVLECCHSNYCLRSGKSKHKFMGSPVKAAMSQVQKQHVKKASRPSQLGNPTILYIASCRKRGRGEPPTELAREFRALPEAEKENWARKHRLQVSARRWERRVKDEEEQAEHEASASKAVKTPWSLGDKTYPVSLDVFTEFLSEFETKASGIEALKRFPKNAKAKSLLTSIVEKGTKYHSRDVASTFARAMLGEQVTDTNCLEGTWGKVVENTDEQGRAGKDCNSLHPGLCKTKDSAILGKVEALVQRFPKSTCDLMLEVSSRPAASRVVIFLKQILGTKRPYRFFFAPMELIGGKLQERVPGAGASCPLPAYKNGSVKKFPFELRLVRAKQGTDLAGCGLFNQFMLAKYLLLLAPDPKHWQIKELETNHQTLSLLTCVGIAQDHGVGKAVKIQEAPPEPSPADDFNFFEVPLMSNPVSKPAKHDARGEASDHDHEDISDFSDGLPSDPEMDEFDLGERLEHDLAPSKRKHAEKKELVGEDSPKKARSDAGSVRGGGHVKTTATDTAMVRAALTSIHRYPLPAGYAIYFQKAYSTYALFHQGRRVSGTTVRIGTGGHEGAIQDVAQFAPAA